MSPLHRLFARSRPRAFRRQVAEAPPSHPNAPVRPSSGRDPSTLIPVRQGSQTGTNHGSGVLAAGVDALREMPHDPELHFARGSALYASRRYFEASSALKRAASLGCLDASLPLRLGWSFYHSADLTQAVEWISMAIRNAPDTSAPHYAMGVALRAQQRLVEAIAELTTALRCDSDNFDAAIALGVSHLDLGNAKEAEAQFRRAIALDEGKPGAWTNLGAALCALDGDHREAALEAFERTDLLEQATGESVDNAVNMGATLQSMGRLREAIDLYERALAITPSIGSHANYAHALLAAGRWSEAWTHYEFRWLRNPLLSLRPKFPRPAWDGQDLNGKTILLRIEQGFGDAIQFVRFAPDLKALGATVLLRVGPGFADLAKGFRGIDRVLDENAPTPEFDYYLHLLSLPRVLGVELDSLPAGGPYLSTDRARSAKWAPRVSSPEARLRVGLAWAGSPAHGGDRYRSVSLRDLAPLGGIPGVRYFSLQKGAKEAEVRDPPAGLDLVNLGPELRDFSDTAAVIEQLDLVICVDTAIGHLAGALGKPVWLLLPQSSDWRWLENRDDSPWYPSMRLFRQAKRGDWRDVVDRIARRLGDSHWEDSPSIAPIAQDKATHSPRVGVTVATDPRILAGHRAGFTAVAETRHGIMQYFPDDPQIGVSIRWYGEYLEEQLRFLARMVERTAVVMEVGAGIGAHSIFLGSTLTAGGHLFLSERQPEMQRVLRQNLSANGVTNFTILPHGLHGENVEQSFPDDTAASGLLAMPRDGVVETLDQLGLERLSWLKINNGASALDILQHGTQTLWRLRPRLFMTCYSELDVVRLVHSAKAFGYRCWCVETKLFSTDNFNRRDRDIFEGRGSQTVLGVPEEEELGTMPTSAIEL